MISKKLELYYKKRNFKKTSEPKPYIKQSKNKNIFVIQKHHATTLHYDFRIEMDGVLKSWVIIKGPSTNPKEKRLAIFTEDHPLDYAKFEGIIPKGYGAGTVIVWDTGTYENITQQNDKKKSLIKAFENGHIKIKLFGKKLQGAYALTKFKSNAWLLIKINDEYADARRNPVRTEPKSVISDKTIEELDKQFQKKIRKT